MFEKMPDKLKALNLTEEQILEKLNSADTTAAEARTLKEKLATLQTEFDTSKTTFEETRARLATLEANASRGGNNNNNNESKTKTTFIDDEDKAFNERFAEGITPVVQMAFNAAKNAAKMAAKNSLFGKRMETPNGPILLTSLWERWASDIDKEADNLAKTNAAALQHEQTWVNLFNYVRGQKVEDLLSKTQEFVETGSTNVDRKVIDNSKPDKLNDEENAILAKMQRYGKGVNAEKILETRKKIKFVGA